VAKKSEGDKGRRVVHMLRRLEELVHVAERRGVKFKDLLAVACCGPVGQRRLPTHRVSWRGGEKWAWGEQESHAIGRQEQPAPG